MSLARRVFFGFFLVFLFGLVLPVQAQIRASAAGPTTRAKTGTVTGRLRAGSVTRRSRLLFLIDGTRHRANVSHNQFTIRNVTTGNHSLSVLDTKNNTGAHVDVRVSSSRTSRVGTLQLAPGGQIAGIVSKVGSGNDGSLEPLGGVEVVAEAISDGWPGNGTGGGNNGGKEEGGLRLVTVTDDSGAYSFRAVPPGFYNVTVSVAGLEKGQMSAWIEVGRTAAVDFALREQIEDGVGTVKGKVVDGKGNALVGVMVSITNMDYGPVEGSPIPRGTFSTLTDNDGRYSLNVPSGYLYLQAWADGFNPVEAKLVLRARDTLTKDLKLERYEQPVGGRVEGIVRDGDTGEPVAGAQVMVGIPVAVGGARPAPGWIAKTDRHGHFVIEGIPAGTWSLIVNADGYEWYSQDVDFEEGATTKVEVALTRLGNNGGGNNGGGNNGGGHDK